MLYALKPDINSLKFSYVPFPFGNSALSTEMSRWGWRYPTIRNTYNAKHQPAISRGSGTHELVIVTQHPGSLVVLSQGFEPSIASSLRFFERVHNVKSRTGERELRLGAGAVSSEETTDGPKPRTCLPIPCPHYTKEWGRAAQRAALHGRA